MNTQIFKNMKHKRLKLSLLVGLMASVCSTGMQAQSPVQLSDTTYTVSNEERTALYCTLSDGTKLFFNNSFYTAYDASGYFYLTLNRIESEQSTLNIPRDYVYRGYRTLLRNVVIVDGEYQCNLQEISVPDGTELFFLPTASALTTLNLPATTVHFNFTFSESFKDLYLRAVYPPYWGASSGISYGLNKPMSNPLTNVTIHVPAMSMNLYAQSEPYNGGSLIALEEPVEHLFVGYQPDTIQNTEGLADNARLTIPRWYSVKYVSNATKKRTCALSQNYEVAFAEDRYENYGRPISYGDEIYFYPAQLTMDANHPVKLQKFRLEQDCGHYWFDSYIDPITGYRYKITPSTAIFNSPVTADEIEMTYHLFRTNVRWKGEYMITRAETGNGRFHLVSFPFDIKLSDITFPPLQDKCKIEVICMEFDGEKRATVAGTNYWRQLASNEVLHANQGYLIDFFGIFTDDSQKTYKNVQTTLHVKAMDTENKQMIFANDDVAVPLTAYPSKYKHREGWNLIGNPYPCFFDIHHLDFTAPITVFDGFSYYAFSPLDDDYYLYPNEAFFIQCPEGTSSIIFKKEGRLHNDPGGLWQFNSSSQMPSRRQMPESGSMRRVYNFLLNGEEGFDRTRIVINEQASTAYEIEHDAAKMLGQDGPQLYVLDGGVQYAIDERPLEDGIFNLGMIFPAAGTYELSLQNNPDEQTPVILTDHQTSAEVDLTQTAYTFDATAGSTVNRFSICLGAKAPMQIQDAQTRSGEPVYYDLQGRVVTEPAMMHNGVYILKQGQTTRKIVK